MKNLTVKPAFHPLACGCIPYVDTQSYEGWHQFGLQVPRGVSGAKAVRVSDGETGRDTLWCRCMVKAPSARTRVATRNATFIETDRVIAGPNGPAIERIRPAVVAASPAEVAVQPATTVDRELYEVAQRVQQNVEAGLLDDILGARETKPEVVTVAAHPMAQGRDRVRTITNKMTQEHRAAQVADPTPRAPRTRPQRANTNEIGKAPSGAMSIADMCAQLAE